MTAVFSLDVDAQNNLYIGDDAEGNALKFTPEGKLVKGWAIPGIVKIAANDTHMAVLGQGEPRRLQPGHRHARLRVWHAGSGRRTSSIFPTGVHIDEQGFVYVADTQNRRVRKFTPSGRLVWDAGTVPDRKFESHVQASEGIFQLPTGVTTDANGRVVVIDAFNYNITVLDGATGKEIAKLRRVRPRRRAVRQPERDHLRPGPRLLRRRGHRQQPPPGRADPGFRQADARQSRQPRVPRIRSGFCAALPHSADRARRYIRPEPDGASGTRRRQRRPSQAGDGLQ